MAVEMWKKRERIIKIHTEIIKNKNITRQVHDGYEGDEANIHGNLIQFFFLLYYIFCITKFN